MRCLFPLVVGLAACLTGAVQAEPFTFTRIAASSAEINVFGGPSINNAGTVVFYAGPDVLSGGIYSGNGGALTTIADGSGEFRPTGFGQFPMINNQGAVAFEAIPDTGGAGVYLSQGGTTTPLAFTGGPLLLVGIPGLNNNNEVVFRGQLDTQPTIPLIFRTDGTTLTTVADTTGPFDYFGDFAGINDAGTIVFSATLDTGGNVIVLSDGGALTTIASTAGEFASFADSLLAINNAGTVAFTATLDTGVAGIYASANGGPITTLVDTSGPFSFIGGPMLNDNGQIAFAAALDSGGFGIFTGADPIANRVIGSGDALDGSTLTNLNYFRGLNDSGQISFYAELADGRRGIYVATPANNSVVPEPSSLALVGAGSVLGILGMARRRRRNA